MRHIVIYHEYLWHEYFFQICFVWSFHSTYVSIKYSYVRIIKCTIRSRLILSNVSIPGTNIVHNYQFRYLRYCTVIIRTMIVFRNLKLSTLLVSIYIHTYPIINWITHNASVLATLQRNHVRTYNNSSPVI